MPDDVVGHYNKFPTNAEEAKKGLWKITRVSRQEMFQYEVEEYLRNNLTIDIDFDKNRKITASLKLGGKVISSCCKEIPEV